MFTQTFYVYIMTNYTNSVLYIGMTNNLIGRAIQHRAKIHPNSFTARYNVKKLVYYETFDHPYDAIRREKQIKAGPRRRKVALIRSINPEFRDLFDTL